MRATTGSAAAAAVAALVFMAPGRGPQVQPVPGPGSGIVTVTGKVEVVNTPDVGASQRGEWKVALANTPEVRVANSPTVAIASPAFVRAGSRYEVFWPAGEKEIVRVVETGLSGWVRVESSRARWLNLTAARAVELVP